MSPELPYVVDVVGQDMATPPPAGRRRSAAQAAGLSAAGSLVVLVIFLVIFFLFRRRRRQQKASKALQLDDDPLDEEELEQGTVPPSRFRYSELAAATGFFKKNMKLGEGGGFGSSVYRGYLKDLDLHVAIKRLSNSHQVGRSEYLSEVKKISGLRHRNLVPLVGWGHGGGGELLLVYELMPNGSLDTHIHNQNHVMPWRLRREVVHGIGSALLYLHQDGVVHRDIKPSNVMLDASFNAKLGDFGLARFIDHKRGNCAHWQSHETVVRTLRYMDPRWLQTGTGGTAFDVYSFGVVVLEIMCACRPIVVAQDDDGATVHLVQWVWRFYGLGRILDAADARLINGEVDRGEMERVMVTALWCAHPACAERPSIRQALSVLRRQAPLPILPLEIANFWLRLSLFTGPDPRNRQ